jgi:AcrR family transcriptional regulator
MTSDTREALLDAAEQLFAERGMYGVSLGEVGRQANQHNRSAIQYHFGSREALIEAIASRHIAELNARRADLVRTLDLTGRGHDLRSLVEALILPPFRLLETSGWHFRFLVQWSVQVSSTQGFVGLLGHPDAGSFGTVLSRVDEAIGDVDPAVRLFRYRNALMTVLRALAEYETAGAAGEPLDEPLAITSLVDLLVGMLAAPDHTLPPAAATATA